MSDAKTPKWSIAEAIDKGNKTYELLQKYLTALQNRLKPDEVETFKSSLDELIIRRSEQAEELVKQKGKTQEQNKAIEELHYLVVDIRNMVKAVSSDSAILQTFGVGEDMDKKGVTKTIASANMIIEGYNKYADWATAEAGILSEDMEEIQELRDALASADSVQENAKYTKKLKTLDKNVLQREVEDKITRISAIGSRALRRKDPHASKLFEELI